MYDFIDNSIKVWRIARGDAISRVFSRLQVAAAISASAGRSWRLRMWRLQRSFDCGHQRGIVRRGLAAVAGDQPSVAADQILVEVPLRRLPAGLGEIAIQRRGLFAHHMHLLEHREFDPVGERAELLDLFLVLELLALEVAGRETEHGESLAAVLRM